MFRRSKSLESSIGRCDELIQSPDGPPVYPPEMIRLLAEFSIGFREAGYKESAEMAWSSTLSCTPEQALETLASDGTHYSHHFLHYCVPLFDFNF
jgi:hypothetical protein